MIVKKSIINSINKAYIKLIKELNYENFGKEFNCEYIICTKPLVNKKVEFRLVYKHIINEDIAFSYWAEYSPKHGRYCITLYVNLHPSKFTPYYLPELNLKLKSIIYHEVEHHLQRIKTPFRASLDMRKYDCEITKYINNEAEIEAYVKQYYFLYTKSTIGFKQIVEDESLHISKDPLVRTRFKKKVYKFICTRKDLNLLMNIQL